MYVVGTAGHVDHGKSTLVKRLTGIDPDRWAEEQRREMTIDLGFAWLTLPGGRPVSIIDVPGHERFIKNMLAGVGGLDAALLVVAADESLMPQTLEHLAILDLLAVEHGLVVITKADLVDAEWLLLVQEELEQHLRGTSFAGVPRVAVSAHTGQGIDTLLTLLEEVLAAIPARANVNGLPRLPVDRSFTIGGFGTVVTGTLLDGVLTPGQEVELFPQGLRARIRGLQSHKQALTEASPGTRVAVNLSGVHHRQIQRGAVLSLPGALQPTQLLDVHLRLLTNAPRPLEHNTPVDLFVGTAETRCHVALLDCETLAPGASGYAQLRLEQPLVTVAGERAIVRQPSPSLTIGGGTIIDTHPHRHRRFRAEVLTALEVRARGTPVEVLLQTLDNGLPQAWDSLMQTSGLPQNLAQEGLATLLADQRVMQLDTTVFITPPGWAALITQLTTLLQSYQRQFPLRAGMPREELRQRLRLEPRLLSAVLEAAAQQHILAWNATTVWLFGFAPAPTPAQQRAVESLLQTLARSPYSPPTPNLDSELLAWMLEQSLLVRLTGDIYFLPTIYNAMMDWVQATLAEQGSVSVAGFRDQFHTSRKYALAFLEHLDERKITRRTGDVRVGY